MSRQHRERRIPRPRLRLCALPGSPLLCLALALVLAACGEDQPSTPLDSPGEVPDQILWDFTTTESDSGQLLWIFQAEEAHVFRKTKQIQSRDIQVDMYGEDGRHNSTLTADSGLIDRRNGQMTAKGQVYVVNRAGYDLRTSVLHYDREREVFYTEAFVEARHGDNILTGYDMECDANLEHMLIRREPRSIIVQGEDRGPD